jgi:hypothetical protein
MKQRFAAAVVVPALFLTVSAAGTAASGFGRYRPAPDPAPVPTTPAPAPEPTIAPNPLPTDPSPTDPTDPGQPRDLVRVSIDEMSGFEGSDKTKVLNAADLMERVISSEQFRQAVLNHQYQGKRQFVQNERSDANGNIIGSNLTNAQVYQILMEGAEQLKRITPRIDNVANVSLALYTPPFYKKWSVDLHELVLLQLVHAGPDRRQHHARVDP